MADSKHIFLLGMPGAGKSTIGPRLAEALSMNFIDSDQAIEHLTSLSIPDMFERYGEKFFREQEHHFLKNLPAQSTVIATGGGLPFFQSNFLILKKRGVLLYLKCSAEILYDRILSESNHPRPLLLYKHPNEVRLAISNLLELRKEKYEESDFIVDAQQSPNLVVNNLVNMLKRNGYGNR